MLTKRTNVLLDETDYSMLVALANSQERTMGDLIRKAIQKTYKTKTKNVRREAFGELRTLAKGIDMSGVNYKDLVDDGRKY